MAPNAENYHQDQYAKAFRRTLLNRFRVACERQTHSFEVRGTGREDNLVQWVFGHIHGCKAPLAEHSATARQVVDTVCGSTHCNSKQFANWQKQSGTALSCNVSHGPSVLKASVYHRFRLYAQSRSTCPPQKEEEGLERSDSLLVHQNLLFTGRCVVAER